MNTQELLNHLHLGGRERPLLEWLVNRLAHLEQRCAILEIRVEDMKEEIRSVALRAQ